MVKEKIVVSLGVDTTQAPAKPKKEKKPRKPKVVPLEKDEEGNDINTQQSAVSKVSTTKRITKGRRKGGDGIVSCIFKKPDGTKIEPPREAKDLREMMPTKRSIEEAKVAKEVEEVKKTEKAERGEQQSSQKS